MYLPDTKSMVLQTDYGNKQYNTLNINDLGGYCAANKPFRLFIQNLFRCFRKVSESVAELTKSVRSCQNSWKKCHFSQLICRLKKILRTFVEKMQIKNKI